MSKDNDIFANFARGDTDAFRKIFGMFYPKIYSFAKRLIQDQEEAKDVTQKIFIRIWVNREKFLDVQDYDSYIFILSKYTILNHIKGKKKIPDRNPPGDIRDSRSPEDKVEMLDIRKKVDSIVGKMPKQRRLIFRMSRILGLKNEEIARELGLSKKTVENHINLALKEIRKELSK